MKTKPGSPVLLSTDDMRRIAQRTKPTDKTVLVRTRQGTIFVCPFAQLQHTLGHRYYTETALLSGTEPKKWNGALVYYAGIEFDQHDRPLIGKTNPIIFGALIANITDDQLRAFLGDETPTDNLWFESK